MFDFLENWCRNYQWTEYRCKNSKWNVCSAWVPLLLKREQMALRLQLAKENLKELQDSDYEYCERLNTVGELWIHHYNRQLKCECEMWLWKGEWKHQEIWLQKSARKVPLVTFFDCRGDDLSNICPPQQRINSEYYTTILKQLLVHICRKVCSWSTIGS